MFRRESPGHTHLTRSNNCENDSVLPERSCSSIRLANILLSFVFLFINKLALCISHQEEGCIQQKASKL